MKKASEEGEGVHTDDGSGEEDEAAPTREEGGKKKAKRQSEYPNVSAEQNGWIGTINWKAGTKNKRTKFFALDQEYKCHKATEEMRAEMGDDAAEPNPPAAKQSDYNGVSWNKQNKTWNGRIFNPWFGPHSDGNREYYCFDRLNPDDRGKACHAKLMAQRAAWEASDKPAFDAAQRAAADAEPTTRGLPILEPVIANAIDGEVYARPPTNTKPAWHPVVRASNKANTEENGGFMWMPACQHRPGPAAGATTATDATDVERPPCNAQAIPAGRGQPKLFCVRHGGGPRCKGATLFGTGEYHACEYNVSVNMGKGGRYDGRCVRCFCVTADPNSEPVRNAKAYMHAREQEVMKLLQAAFLDYDWTFDQGYGTKFAVGERKRNASVRPDARTIKHGRILIVEVDELSHIAYDCGKEREREEIFSKRAGPRLSLVMLRFNPDHYTDLATGLRVPSCFHYNKKKGSVTPDPAQKKQWDLRIEALFARVRVFLDRKDPAYMEEVPEPPPGRCIYMEELFYDDVSGVTDAGKAKIVECFKKAAVKRKRKADAAGV